MILSGVYFVSESGKSLPATDVYGNYENPSGERDSATAFYGRRVQSSSSSSYNYLWKIESFSPLLQEQTSGRGFCSPL